MRKTLLAVAAIGGAVAFATLAVAAGSSMDANYADSFRNEAAAEYRSLLSRLSARGTLDDDEATLARVRKIGPGLIAAAASLRAETSEWTWEIHVTSEPAVQAFCMAGGKLLIGGAFVRRLKLTDGELAMLLGHEIAHAVADHRREISRTTTDADAAGDIRQVGIAAMQESEADRIGMVIAHRAGWPAASLLSFFDKLAAAQPPGTFGSGHPDAASRVAAARAMALALETPAPQSK